MALNAAENATYCKEEPFDDAENAHPQIFPTPGASCVKQETFVKLEPITAEQRRALICAFCEYHATEKSSLEEHMRIHKPFRCHLCSFKCADSAAFNFHLKTHTEKPPFACNLCEYRTRQIKDLTGHMKVHSKLANFECGSCDFRTTRKRFLDKHQKSHVDGNQCDCGGYKTSCRVHRPRDKTFKCSVCDFSATQSARLIAHMSIHKITGVCQYCGRKTRKKWMDKDGLTTVCVCDECSTAGGEVNAENNTDGDLIYHTVTYIADSDNADAFQGMLGESEPVLFDLDGFQVERADVKNEIAL